MKIANIFKNIPTNLPEEIFDEIVKTGNCKIERVVSKGQRSPEDYWYDQEQNEWVIILKGSATLKFENEVVKMQTGDYINIPAHCKHRVERTNPETETVWLAVFY